MLSVEPLSPLIRKTRKNIGSHACLFGKRMSKIITTLFSPSFSHAQNTVFFRDSEDVFAYIIVEYGEPWPPLVTGLPGLHDNAASADACR